MKFKEKLLAIKLRKRGLSYKKILRSIKISKSTLSLWLRDIDLTAKQQKELLREQEQGRYVAAKNKRNARISKTKEIVRKSSEEVAFLIDKPLFLAGLCLYLGEGTKNWRESVKFANSDEKMIKLMMQWFREFCSVPEKKFRIHLHIHNLHTRTHIEKFWSKTTGIPLKQFYKTYVKQSSLGQRKNILYNGTCTVIINNKELFRKITGWKIGLQNHFNINN